MAGRAPAAGDLVEDGRALTVAALILLALVLWWVILTPHPGPLR